MSHTVVNSKSTMKQTWNSPKARTNWREIELGRKRSPSSGILVFSFMWAKSDMTWKKEQFVRKCRFASLVSLTASFGSWQRNWLFKLAFRTFWQRLLRIFSASLSPSKVRCLQDVWLHVKHYQLTKQQTRNDDTFFRLLHWKIASCVIWNLDFELNLLDSLPDLKHHSFIGWSIELGGNFCSTLVHNEINMPRLRPKMREQTRERPRHEFWQKWVVSTMW